MRWSRTGCGTSAQRVSLRRHTTGRLDYRRQAATTDRICPTPFPACWGACCVRAAAPTLSVRRELRRRHVIEKRPARVLATGTGAANRYVVVHRSLLRARYGRAVILTRTTILHVPLGSVARIGSCVSRIAAHLILLIRSIVYTHLLTGRRHYSRMSSHFVPTVPHVGWRPQVLLITTLCR